ncbi:15-hydroxyprostaglandin dehydrogenase [NAD(+)]-like [Schistocerca americana]|uniref:15-hydroxyprostaglandin dehydrogenase [NAD(+)]-like n=1 Tax=Schistocerca americana TaxID=7009 RepID=UPI001F4FBB4A|nr:15-hydroxyprostaglandin dehydrogenase [NAD(+)]-like [Schistocerca americana]
MDLRGKVALVTGAGGVLGGAFCRVLLGGGAKVMLTDINDAAGMKAAEELQEQFGRGSAIFVKANVADSESLEEVFRTAKSTFGRLDIVVNSAGILRESVWRQEVDINLKGTIGSVLLAFQYMGRDRGGRGGLVVNVSSTAGLEPSFLAPVYCSTKAAVAALTRAYGDATYTDKTGVSVVALCPGPTESPLLLDSLEHLMHDYIKQPLAQLLSAAHINRPEFIAEALTRVIREGRSGSVCVANEGVVRQVDFPRLV